MTSDEDSKEEDAVEVTQIPDNVVYLLNRNRWKYVNTEPTTYFRHGFYFREKSKIIV